GLSTGGNLLFGGSLGQGFFTLWDPTVAFGAHGALYAAYIRLGYTSVTRFPTISYWKSSILRTESPTFKPPAIYDQPWPVASQPFGHEWLVIGGNDVRRPSGHHPVVMASTNAS